MTQAARKRRSSAALILPLIVLSLIGSVAVRLASGTGAAIAAEVGSLMPADAGGESCQPVEPDLVPVLDRLAARETAVTDAEAQLAQRHTLLAAAEERMTRRLADLKAAEASLDATMQKTSTAAEDDIARLTNVYEAMKPKDAIPLFEAMDPAFAGGFLARMRPETAGAILSGMKPETAYAISVILAGRNSDVPVPAKQ